ncbi:MAG TPA: serine protease [Gemmataceae bacterium]|jgi:S1-C subfamily serine protease
MPRRLVLAAALLAAAPAPAADRPPLSGKEIYQRTLKSTAWIAHAVEVGRDRAVLLAGTGSVIDVHQRLILTNFHVVAHEAEVRVFFPQFDKQNKLIAAKDHYLREFQAGGGLKGKVLYRDEKRDLAVVQVDRLPSGTTAVPLARESVGPGDTVHSIGNPGASDALWAYTPGAVKAVYKKTWSVRDRGEVHNFEATVVETTSPVNPGDSGGPLLNGAGELVAVTQGGVSAQGTISYFIDISEVRALLTAKKVRLSTAPAAAVAAATEKVEEKAPPPKDAAADQAEKDEKTARAKLALAEMFLPDRPEKARERLEEIIKAYPQTKAAREAKEQLAKLKKG